MVVSLLVVMHVLTNDQDPTTNPALVCHCVAFATFWHGYLFVVQQQCAKKTTNQNNKRISNQMQISLTTKPQIFEN